MGEIIFYIVVIIALILLGCEPRHTAKRYYE